MKSPTRKRRSKEGKGKGKEGKGKEGKGSKGIILEEKGLKINNNLVTSISGPVSMVIIKPLQKFSTHKNPIFILFGDIHDSYSGMCEECTCGGGESCCYPIYSPELIKLIDGIAKHHTVYFSTEYGLNDPFLKLGKMVSGPSRKFLETIALCNMKKRQCFTKNINWQLVDIRNNWKKYDFFNCMQDLFVLLIWMNDETISKYLVDNKATEIAQKYQQYYEIVLKFMDKDFYKKQSDHNLIYKQSAKMSKEWEVYIEKYYEVFWERVYKLTEFSVKFYKELIDFIFSRIPSPFHRHTVFESLEKYRFSWRNKDLGEDIFMYTAVSVDLYFILRSFKTTSSKKNAVVSIAYLGVGHTDNIEKFLTEIKGDYEVVFSSSKPSIDSSDINRCLEIDKPIDLNKLIEEIM